MYRLLTCYWKTFCFTCIIAVVSLVPFSADTLPHMPHGDKWVHLILYFVLSFILFVDLYRQAPSDRSKWMCVVALYAVFFGGLMEILQGVFTVSRSASWLDLLADVAGSGLFCLAAYLFFYWHRR